MALTSPELFAALSSIDGLAPESLQLITAERLAKQYYPHLDPAQPALVLGLSDSALALQIQPALLRAYPSQHACSLISDGARRFVALRELAEQIDVTHSACLFIPALPAPSSLAALQDIIAHLRAPEGCPWDRELTWAKLRAHLLEESYELLDALDAADPMKVAEELGDLLLQVGMQTQIATEEGLFTLPTVIQGIVGKLIRRHPHVFGDAIVSGTGDVLANWEAIKRAERESNGDRRSPLSGVPRGLPALAQADAYLDRMSRLGSIPSSDTPWGALAGAPSDSPLASETVGDALFALVAWAQARGVDSESALREASARYAAQIESGLG